VNGTPTPPILRVYRANGAYEIAHLALDGPPADLARQLDRASYTVERQGARRYPTEHVASDVATLVRNGWVHAFCFDCQPRDPRRHV